MSSAHPVRSLRSSQSRSTSRTGRSRCSEWPPCGQKQSFDSVEQRTRQTPTSAERPSFSNSAVLHTTFRSAFCPATIGPWPSILPSGREGFGGMRCGAREDEMAAIMNEPLSRHALAFVLAGGRGSRLLELTDRRAKPAVYFGGKSRIIDFALSNAVNSGIRRIAVATQYKAHSLIRHLQMGWNFFRPERNESFDILPASQRVSETNWYLGTADAVYQNIDIIESHEAKFIVLLAGDHIYKMDYERMLKQHVEQRADVTIGCLEMPRAESSGFGIMHVDDNGIVLSFLEKPADPPPMPGKPDKSLASMGIYVFDSKLLFDELRRDANDPNSSHDFGKDIIPYIVKNGRAVAHQFTRSCVRSNG